MKKLNFAQVRLIMVLCSLLLYTLLEVYICWNIEVVSENIFAEVSFYILVFLNSIVFKVGITSLCDYLANKITDTWY